MMRELNFDTDMTLREREEKWLNIKSDVIKGMQGARSSATQAVKLAFMGT
jgi:hypothetical protein